MRERQQPATVVGVLGELIGGILGCFGNVVGFLVGCLLFLLFIGLVWTVFVAVLNWVAGGF